MADNICVNDVNTGVFDIAALEIDGVKFLKTVLVDSSGNLIGEQYPLSTDGDSVHVKDIDTDNSSIGDFSGAISDLFNNRTSTITTSTDNPSLTISLNRPVNNKEITIITSSGNFSNTKIIAKSAAGTTLETLDESGIDTKRTERTFAFENISKWCILEISFTTTDDVTLSFISIPTGVHTLSRIFALKPDGTVIAIDVDPVRSNMEGGGAVSVGTTALEATFTGTPTRLIVITADPTNTGLLFIGKSNVTNLGANAFAMLDAGERIEIPYDDATNAVYVVSDTADQTFYKGALL
jgi:hypothetical protein